MDAIHLAGIGSEQDGYEVKPHLPMSTFQLRFPQVGLAQQDGLIRG